MKTPELLRSFAGVVNREGGFFFTMNYFINILTFGQAHKYFRKSLKLQKPIKEIIIILYNIIIVYYYYVY